MRTTVNLPDDLYDVVRSVAATKHISLGQAMADLLRKGLYPPPRFETKAGFPCFAVGEDASPITLEHTLEVEDEA